MYSCTNGSTYRWFTNTDLSLRWPWSIWTRPVERSARRSWMLSLERATAPSFSVTFPMEMHYEVILPCLTSEAWRFGLVFFFLHQMLLTEWHNVDLKSHCTLCMLITKLFTLNEEVRSKRKKQMYYFCPSLRVTHWLPLGCSCCGCDGATASVTCVTLAGWTGYISDTAQTQLVQSCSQATLCHSVV